ncbi:hypothetical protein [Flavobacterium sp.]|uniref:hypothetical protein n=1 Tax=Flavobacterium sp. TaxID=239 RepID=UPI0039E3B952
MDLENQNFILQVIILIIQFFIVLIPFLGSKALYDRRKRPLNRFSFRGYMLLILGILLIICTCLQIKITNKISFQNEVQLNKKLERRDSINQRENKKNDIATKEALAKYNLEIQDSLNNAQIRIRKIIKDSAKINVMNGDDPDFGICDIKKIKDTLSSKSVEIKICSNDAASEKITFAIDVIVEVSPGKYQYIGKNVLSNKNIFVGKNKSMSPEILIPNKITNQLILFHMVGEYTKFGTKKKFNLDRLYCFNQYAPTKPYGYLFPDKEEQVREFIKTSHNRR